MVELYILNDSFAPLALIDDFRTLIWTRRYYECGCFELHAAPELFSEFRAGVYLYSPDLVETGLIEYVKKEVDPSGKSTLVVKGRFAEALLQDRVIERPYTYDGTPEAVLRQMMDAFLLNPADSARKRTDIVPGAPAGLGAAVSGQITGSPLCDAFYGLCKTQELSFRVALDYLSDRLVFTVWQGLDRTENQIDRSPATFSDDYENITSSVFEQNDSDYKNFAYVAGEGEGDERFLVEVDRTAPGEARRELYVDARNVRRTKDENDVEMTDQAYAELLKEAGLEKLASRIRVESVSGTLDANGNLIYGTDFDLGDKCTYIDAEAGIERVDRITQVQEVFESGKHEIVPQIGEASPTILKRISR